MPPRRARSASPPARPRRTLREVARDLWLAARLDLGGAVVATLVAVASWQLWGLPDAPWMPAGGPGWARPGDYLLDGPDAGAWAANANALLGGRLADLDPHRLPIYPYLTAGLMWLWPAGAPDAALAGHLVNHLCLALLAPVIYLLGARWMQRGLALGAAIVVVTWLPAVAAAQRYGVDPAVALAVPLAMLGAEVGAAFWWLAPLAGMLAGAAAATHLTTVGLPIPALLLCLLRGERGWRWLGALGFALGVAAGGHLVFLHYPILPQGMVAATLAEGVDPVANNAGRAGMLSSPAAAVAAVWSGLPHALSEVMRFVATHTRPAWSVWAVALVVPWLGVLGPELGRTPTGLPTRDVARLALRRLGAGLAAGIPACLALAPVLAFAAAGSPERYTDNYFPLVVVIVFRGFGLCVALATRRLGGAWPELAALGVGLLLVAGLVHPDAVHREMDKPPTPEAVAVRQLGELIRAHFAPGGGASCTLREADAYAGRMYCPYSSGAEFAGKPEPVRLQLAKECSGEGDVPYVVLEGAADGASDARKAMDRWVVANGRPVDTLTLPQFTATLYAVARPE